MDVDRFWSKVNKTDTCWEWTRGLHNGYGQFNIGRRPVGAHIVAYELMVGPVPQGLELDHLCRNRKCVRPDHLEPVTPLENWERGESPSRINRDKTHCKWGHEFTDENTWINKKTGWRQCRACFKRRSDEVRKRRLARHGTTKRAPAANPRRRTIEKLEATRDQP